MPGCGKEQEAVTVEELGKSGLFECIEPGTAADRTITTPYCCDLLSIAMGRAPEGCAWVTVMGNINTLAVAALTDAACVILAEGVRLDEAAAKKAKEQGITVFASEQPVFETAMSVYGRLQGSSLTGMENGGDMPDSCVTENGSCGADSGAPAEVS